MVRFSTGFPVDDNAVYSTYSELVPLHVKHYNNRMRKYALFAALLLAAVAGARLFWQRHHHAVMASTPSAQEASVSGPSDLSQDIIGELAALKPGITVAEWRSVHSGDRLHKASYSDDEEYPVFVFGNFCTVATRTEHLSSGDDLSRKAVFYLPEAPASKALPAETDPSALIDTCRLGYIQVEVMKEDTLAALNANIHSGLTTRFGPPKDEPNALVLAPVLRRQMIPVWHAGDVRFVVGSVLQTVRPDAQQSKFSAYAYLPVFPFEREHPDEPYDFMEAENSPEIFQLAMRTAALETGVSQSMTEVFRKWIEFYQRKSGLPYEEQPKLPRPVQPREVAGVLEPWLDASRDLPARRRAAALLAAQFMLEASWAEFTSAAEYPVLKSDTETQTLLEAAGAEFLAPGGPQGIQPLVKWAREARDLDPEGPIGDAITLMTLSGWHLRELFPGGDVTDYVIDVSERYLLRHRDSANAGTFEYFIASAYCDRFLISQIGDDAGEGNFIPPTPEQLARGAAAKPEALNHYRSVFAQDRNSTKAIAAWRSAWRLIAGLPVSRHYSVAGE